MNACRKCEDLFEKALYDELSNDESQFFNGHLASCKECAGQFNEFKEIIGAAKMDRRPEPEESFMENFWDNLAPKIESVNKHSKKRNVITSLLDDLTRKLDFVFRWKYQLAGGLALLVIGVFIGTFFNNRTQTDMPLAGNNKITYTQTAVNAEAANYLERSKVLLMGLVNYDPSTDDPETISLPHIKTISRELLNQAPELKAGLKDPSQQQVKQLVADLEVILLQIANLEAKKDMPGIELIKDGVNTRGIFLKINIQEILENNKEAKQQKIRTKSETSNI